MNADTMNYDPLKHGTVRAIRIFMSDDYRTPMAELAFAYGGTTVIQFNNIAQREKFSSGITGYTVYFDERFPALDFSHFVKPV